jgi:hypothetical protein
MRGKLVVREGKPPVLEKMITYWCDVCCQKETTVDLIDPDKLGQ